MLLRTAFLNRETHNLNRPLPPPGRFQTRGALETRGRHLQNTFRSEAVVGEAWPWSQASRSTPATPPMVWSPGPGEPEKPERSHHGFSISFGVGSVSRLTLGTHKPLWGGRPRKVTKPGGAPTIHREEADLGRWQSPEALSRQFRGSGAHPLKFGLWENGSCGSRVSHQIRRSDFEKYPRTAPESTGRPSPRLNYRPAPERAPEISGQRLNQASGPECAPESRFRRLNA